MKYALTHNGKTVSLFYNRDKAESAEYNLVVKELFRLEALGVEVPEDCPDDWIAILAENGQFISVK